MKDQGPIEVPDDITHYMEATARLKRMRDEANALLAQIRNVVAADHMPDSAIVRAIQTILSKRAEP